MRGDRLEAIRKIVETQVIQRQDELVEELQKAGFRVTQATVSRDMNRLRIEKITTENGTVRYVLPPQSENMVNHRLFRILSESVISLACSRNLLVIQTLPGTAHAAGEAVDTLGWEEILGTIAGDNTILAVIREDVAADNVLRRLEEIIG